MSKYWGLILVFGLILVGKLSGLLKDLLITFYHGVSTVTDAYFLSNSIASLLYMAVYSAIPILIVPMCSRLIAEQSSVRLRKDLSAGLGFFLAVSICIASLIIIAAEPLVDLFSGAVQQEVRTRAVSYLSIMAWTFALSTLVSFFNSIQTVRKMVLPSYSVPVVNNSVFCAGLYLFSGVEEFSHVLVLGIVAWLVMVLINGWLCKSVFTFSPMAAFDFFKEKRFILLFLPAVLAFYIEQVNGFVGVYFASGLGLGAISVYGYSNKLNLVFLSVFLVFLTASLFPRIAAVVGKEDRESLREYLLMCIRLVVIVGVPGVIYMYYYSSEIVSLIFQRGKFMAEDTLKVSAVFSLVLLALPFSLIRDIMNRVFFSHHDTVTPVLLSLGALVVNFLLCYGLSQQYGLVGVAAAAVVSTVLNCGLAVELVRRRIGGGLWMPCVRIISICVMAGAVSTLLLDYLNSQFTLHWILLCIPFGLVYFLVLLGLGVKEIKFVSVKLAKLAGC